VPWSIHRLVLAAAVMTDSAICYSYAPPAEPGEALGIWDELVRGRDRQVGRLGRLRGSSRQDPETNSGEPVGQTVTLGPKDALFLMDASAVATHGHPSG